MAFVWQWDNLKVTEGDCAKFLILLIWKLIGWIIKAFGLNYEGLRPYLWRPSALSAKLMGLFSVWPWHSLKVNVLSLCLLSRQKSLDWVMKVYLWRCWDLFVKVINVKVINLCLTLTHFSRFMVIFCERDDFCEEINVLWHLLMKIAYFDL